MIWFFVFFFVSGLCSLTYQVVWLRVAMAGFGVTTPLISIVLSVFMAGLALGSFAAGRLARELAQRPARSFLRLYALAEMIIGVSGIAVAPLLGWGRSLLAASAEGAAWGSAGYYLASAAWVTLALLPFCACMGATIPLAMAGMRARFGSEARTSFSFLYVANVAGALAGTLGSAFVSIELFGFHRTLLIAAGLNVLVAAASLALSRDSSMAAEPRTMATIPGKVPVGSGTLPGSVALPLLFLTGLASLAMEVVWVRQFMPFQGPVVYSFAIILAVYLAATIAGSKIYRVWVRRNNDSRADREWRITALLAGLSGLLPLLAADPRLALPGGELPATLRVAVGIAPFCGLLGFLTPLLVDRWAAGDPLRAGTAYAVNTLGCILGPLISGFALLPLLGERWTLVALALPLFAFGAAAVPGRAGFRPQRTVAAVFCVSAATALFLILFTKSYESVFPGCEVRRDHTATVIAAGEGMQKQLLINGMGITSLTPITKMMAHLPMAFLERPPRNGIVLCFGMGTSFRSMLAWGIATTGVELVPSVPSLFAFYHRDGEQLRQSPLARIVIDDARRFLERSRETYDVIAVDPPPPVEAAGSSLLYSREFYETARRRLRPGGILQQWLPDGSPTLVSAVARALAETFPHVRAFFSMEGWGVHFLASTQPIPVKTATELAARLPAAAARDLIEWGPAPTPAGQFQAVVSREVPMWRLIEADPKAPTLTDDRPVNEYYFLRNMFGSGNS